MEALKKNTFTTFDDPLSLKTAVSRALSDSTSNIPTHICVRILAPLAGKVLTETELNGGVDRPECPNMACLVEEWRDAFRQIPSGHSCAFLQYDMTAPRDMELRHIGRLIQVTSTAIQLKAGSRGVNFSITGCTDEQRRYLESGLPQQEGMRDQVCGKVPLY